MCRLCLPIGKLGSQVSKVTKYICQFQRSVSCELAQHSWSDFAPVSIPGFQPQLQGLLLENPVNCIVELAVQSDWDSDYRVRLSAPAGLGQ